MSQYRVTLKLDVYDEPTLELLVVSSLQDQGKTPEEIQELLYDEGAFQPEKALGVIYVPLSSFTELDLSFPSVELLQTNISTWEDQTNG